MIKDYICPICKAQMIKKRYASQGHIVYWIIDSILFIIAIIVMIFSEALGYIFYIFGAAILCLFIWNMNKRKKNYFCEQCNKLFVITGNKIVQEYERTGT